MPFAIRALRLALAGAAALAAHAGAAHAQSVDATYQITLGGLSIGVASLKANLNGEKYDLAVSAKLTGLIGAVAGGNGAATAGGGLGGGQPLPATFSLRSSNGKETRVVRMALTGGNVEKFSIEPPVEPKPDDEKRVPLTPAHRRAVVDPVSALLMPVKAPLNGGALDPAACNRTIPVFDGAARYDVILTYKATQQANAGDYAGPVLVCAARYRPVAGHRPERKGTKFMAENRDIEAWLAPVAGTRVLLPLRIAVKTQVGMSIIHAARFDVRTSAAAR